MGTCRSSQKVEFELQYAPRKLGKWKVFSHPIGNTIIWIYRELAYEALRLAEQEKGAPVNLPEVCRAYRKITKTPLIAPHILTAAILDFYWNDQILGDREINYCSINPKM